MAEVKLENINKIYPNGVQAVHDFSIGIQDKEFIVFVGPSGCGKSTTLRMIAGLEDITSGKLYINNRLCNDESPKDRDIAMVFQSYALYPHMTVYKNMAFGLKMRLVPSPVLDEKGNPVMTIDGHMIRQLESDIRHAKKYINRSERNCHTINNKVDQTIKKMEAQLKDPKLDPAKKADIEKNMPLFKAYKVDYNKDYKARQLEMNEKLEGIKERLEYFKKTPVAKNSYHHIPKNEIDERVHEAAKILEIEDYLDRKPNALSGGQRQRVALGRAIVRKAKVFLMDEPLSNLDAKLRVQMRSEIVKLHERIGATTIYVTHDQTEAMTMATRIVVMKDGYIQQIGTPIEIYHHPTNKFVAGFIGSPSMNFTTVTLNDGFFNIDGLKVNIPDSLKESVKGYIGKELILGIRPEDIIVSTTPKEGYIEKESQISELLGSELLVHFDMLGGAYCAKVFGNATIPAHSKIYISFRPEGIHFFNKETEKAI
jgi:multiple sugar transport system ATP-binding protein